MTRWIGRLLLIGLSSYASACAVAADPPTSAPTTRPGQAHFPHLRADLAARQVRVECEALAVDIPLEFFCVLRGTSEHESVLRTSARPEHLHTALLMLGLKPGHPVRYSQAANRWLAPDGPPLRISCEFVKEGRTVRVPAYALLRNVQTKRPMPPMTWIFVGSALLDNGAYAADVTGYVVSMVNFEMTVIDVPELASSANETLQWELNPEVMPPAGTPVTMIVEPAGAVAQGAGAPEAPAPIDVVLVTMDESGQVQMDRRPVSVEQLVERLTRMVQERPVTVRLTPQALAPRDRFARLLDALRRTGATVQVAPPAVEQATGAAPQAVDIAALRQKWEQAVQPHRAALKEVAQAHFEVIAALRARQQGLIDEADKLQRLINQLERQYHDMTSPSVPQP